MTAVLIICILVMVLAVILSTRKSAPRDYPVQSGKAVQPTSAPQNSRHEKLRRRAADTSDVQQKLIVMGYRRVMGDIAANRDASRMFDEPGEVVDGEYLGDVEHIEAPRRKLLRG
jgi:hypothetical protein